jgi:HTH-type transcriptional regulator/antitoxin HigA
MDIKPIRTDEDYQAALAEIDRLMDAEPGTPEDDKVEVLITLVEAYEHKHYPPELPSPIEAVKFHMERLNLTRKDLEPYIGQRGRVSEILNLKRPLTLRMIRNLASALDIPLEILAQPYDLDKAASKHVIEAPQNVSIQLQSDQTSVEEMSDMISTRPRASLSS